MREKTTLAVPVDDKTFYVDSVRISPCKVAVSYQGRTAYILANAKNNRFEVGLDPRPQEFIVAMTTFTEAIDYAVRNIAFPYAGEDLPGQIDQFLTVHGIAFAPNAPHPADLFANCRETGPTAMLVGAVREILDLVMDKDFSYRLDGLGELVFFASTSENTRIAARIYPGGDVEYYTTTWFSGQEGRPETMPVRRLKLPWDLKRFKRKLGVYTNAGRC